MHSVKIATSSRFLLKIIGYVIKYSTEFHRKAECYHKVSTVTDHFPYLHKAFFISSGSFTLITLGKCVPKINDCSYHRSCHSASSRASITHHQKDVYLEMRLLILINKLTVSYKAAGVRCTESNVYMSLPTLLLLLLLSFRAPLL